MRLGIAATAPNPWTRVLEALEKKVNRHSYETWLKPTRYSHANGKVLVIQVPTPEFKHIGDKYGDLIQEAIENLHLEFDDVEFVPVEQHEAPRPGPGQTAVRHNGGFNAAGKSAQSRFDWDSAAQLNQRYTFDAFVTGNGNQFAAAAAHAVADNPAKMYNPLF